MRQRDGVTPFARIRITPAFKLKAIMALTQAEADALLQMPNEFVEVTPLEFPNSQALCYVRELRSVDRRELFLFDFERGNRNRARLKYQVRGRKVVILARLDLNGPAHRNPPNAPHRPGVRLACPHFHRYIEGFEDKVAFEPADVPGLSMRDLTNGVICLEDFLKYCAVQSVPNIQLMV
jgi:hypothetical protein